MRQGHDNCYYCGLPFYTHQLPRGTPGAAKARGLARPTLEHLIPRSKGGENKEDNCVVAHFYCNSIAARLPLEEKMKLKQRFLNNSGKPPWLPLLEKVIQKHSAHDNRDR
jgi:5-methylcytosine-specific restriction endonuclease McrA